MNYSQVLRSVRNYTKCLWNDEICVIILLCDLIDRVHITKGDFHELR